MATKLSNAQIVAMTDLHNDGGMSGLGHHLNGWYSKKREITHRALERVGMIEIKRNAIKGLMMVNFTKLGAEMLHEIIGDDEAGDSEDIISIEPQEGTLADELPEYRDEAFEEAQRNMTPADYDDLIPAAGSASTSEIIPPTGPTLSPIAQVALDNHDSDFCYMTMTPQIECECAWCKLARVEAENAALKVKIDKYEEALRFAYNPHITGSYGLLVVGQKAGRVLGLLPEEHYEEEEIEFPEDDDNEIDHSEISARQSDDTENRNAGEGVFF